MPDPQLIDESDRGAVIVAAAVFDAKLEDMLRKEFAGQNLSKKQLKKLFDANGPLATFSSKTLICRAINLISEDIYHDLEIIRGLRNRFAHGTENVDFLDQSVSDSVTRLKVFNRAAADFRGKTHTLNPQHKALPAWEMRSKGFLKFAKAAFCLSVQILDLAMTEHSIRRYGYTGPLPSLPDKPFIARLYYVTTRENGDWIVRNGFPESAILDTNDQEHRGVWLTRRPMLPLGLSSETAACFAVEMPATSFQKFGMREEGKADSELRWHVPATIVNAQPRKLLSADELELVGHPEPSDD